MTDSVPEGMSGLEVFSTLPQSSLGLAGRDYLAHVVQVARWSEEAGCRGILIYSDNSLVDPWLLAQVVLDSTLSLSPLVAVQPIYMHPFAVATMVSTLGHLYGRQIYLNMIAGGFKNDLMALDDQTAHDRRYDRLVEYTALIQSLLASQAPVSHAGDFYKVTNLRLLPTVPSELLPEIFVSGSSEAGIAAARALGAVAVRYPKPPRESEADPPPTDLRCGIRVGIIARERGEDAWEVAMQRFPDDRKGELMHDLAMKVSDSVWHKQLSNTAELLRGDRETYWLHPFETFKTFCPYLVGTYGAVADELARYMSLGYSTFVLDWPAERDELIHTRVAFARAAQRAR